MGDEDDDDDDAASGLRAYLIILIQLFFLSYPRQESARHDPATFRRGKTPPQKNWPRESPLRRAGAAVPHPSHPSIHTLPKESPLLGRNPTPCSRFRARFPTIPRRNTHWPPGPCS
ncbi:hypothetical protein L228DRAFT_13715 [Xylona heveae TC161]|uniref:Uncharacterized protein n=1 Tax=Xylona heveae (strain CBS 132557 / TC161) TaxID=1328760 RepID=A0A165JQ06_XYLHT|nr:hypothetical protein L228DRAFT_13715 [Xylona heveae TC161]KZF26499.1 hypothetical protein L228DRAFT_13715 [Xylona heveae TC161]